MITKAKSFSNAKKIPFVRLIIIKHEIKKDMSRKIVIWLYVFELQKLINN